MNNPWLALSTYEEKDKDRFKGREKDTENMLKMLQQNEYVVCYAASGDGKSSLINAGVCPAMKKIGYYPIKIVFSSDEYDGLKIPLKEDKKIDFDTCILRKIEDVFRKTEESEGQMYFETEEQFASFPSSLSSKLWWKLRTQTVQIPFGEFDYIPILIFDQFEEILRAKWKNEFFAWLEELSSDECPVSLYDSISDYEIIPSQKKFKTIFSMRYEYVGELDYWCSQRRFIPQLMHSRYFLKPLNAKQAYAVIIEQYEGQPEALDIIKKNASQIIQNLDPQTSIYDDNWYNKGINEETEISAILLSILCYVFYNRIVDEGNVTLPETKDLVSSFYLTKLSELEIFESELESIEDKLVTKEGTRKRAVFLNDIPALNKLIQTTDKHIGKKTKCPLWKVLKDAHLLNVEKNDEGCYVEFVHDKLAEAANEERKIRNKRKKANYVKIIFGLLGIVLFWSAFVSEVYIRNTNGNLVNADDICKYAEYQVVNAESSGYLRSPSLKKVKLESNSGEIHFYFGDLPNLETIELNDTLLKNNYCWENGILWHYKNDPDTYSRERVLFVSSNALRVVNDIHEDYYENYGIYKRSFLEANRDSIVTENIKISKDSVLYAIKEPINLIDTLDLSSFSNITVLGNNVFENCSFSKVILPCNLKKISQYAFKDCKKLKSIEFKSRLRNIEMCSFYRCDELSKIELYDSCKIESRAFYDCPSFRTLVVNNKISYSCFEQCDSVVVKDSNDSICFIINNPLVENNKMVYGGYGREVLLSGVYDLRNLFIETRHPSDSLKSVIGSASVHFYDSAREINDIYLINDNIVVDFSSLDSVNCSQIILHVPQNSLQVMKDRYKDLHFKDITEMSLLETSFHLFCMKMYFAFGWFSNIHSIWYIFITLFLLITLFFILLRTNKKNKKYINVFNAKSIKGIASSVILFLIFMFATYWYIYLQYGYDQNKSWLTGLIVGLFIALISTKSDWIQDNFMLVYKDCNKHFKTYFNPFLQHIKTNRLLYIVIGILLGFTIWYHFFYKNEISLIIDQLSKDEKYAEIAAIMNDGLLSSDTSKVKITDESSRIEIIKPDFANAVIGKNYVGINNDSTITIWDMTNGKKVQTYKSNSKILQIIISLEDKYVYARTESAVLKYTTESTDLLGEYKDSLSYMSLSLNGKFIVSELGNELLIIESQSMKLLRTVPYKGYFDGVLGDTKIVSHKSDSIFLTNIIDGNNKIFERHNYSDIITGDNCFYQVYRDSAKYYDPEGRYMGKYFYKGYMKELFYNGYISRAFDSDTIYINRFNSSKVDRIVSNNGYPRVSIYSKYMILDSKLYDLDMMDKKDVVFTDIKKQHCGNYDQLMSPLTDNRVYEGYCEILYNEGKIKVEEDNVLFISNTNDTTKVGRYGWGVKYSIWAEEWKTLVSVSNNDVITICTFTGGEFQSRRTDIENIKYISSLYFSKSGYVIETNDRFLLNILNKKLYIQQQHLNKQQLDKYNISPLIYWINRLIQVLRS